MIKCSFKRGGNNIAHAILGGEDFYMLQIFPVVADIILMVF